MTVKRDAIRHLSTEKVCNISISDGAVAKGAEYDADCWTPHLSKASQAGMTEQTQRSCVLPCSEVRQNPGRVDLLGQLAEGVRHGG